jgi:uncharacterized protein YecE (DUF72 family)
MRRICSRSSPPGSGYWASSWGRSSYNSVPSSAGAAGRPWSGFSPASRGPEWIEPSVLRLLAEHRVALALVDGRWLPRELMLELTQSPTTDFAYVRWMGPDRAIEDYSRVVVNREHEIAEWAAGIGALAERVSQVHGYFNNHFQGHSPASARALQRLVGQRPVEPAELAEQVELF